MSVEQRAAVLAHTEPFQVVDEGMRRRIAKRLDEREVEAGHVIFWQGEPGESMFVLVEGSVKLVVHSKDGELVELVRHQAPAIFGELAVLDGGPRSATAEAVERSVLFVLTRAELLQLMRAEKQVAEALARLLAMMVRRTTQQVTDLAILRLQGPVAE